MLEPAKTLKEGFMNITLAIPNSHPWALVYKEHFEDLKIAKKREIQIKRKKSRKYYKWLLCGWFFKE